MESCLPTQQHQFSRDSAGKPFPQERIDLAGKELDEFARLLECEGVNFRRPEPNNQSLMYGALGWSGTGMYAAMPRNVLLVVGTECSLAWRSRYFETADYKNSSRNIFVAVPNGVSDRNPNYRMSSTWIVGLKMKQRHRRLMITGFKPTFGAADFTKLGKDMIAQESNVANEFGIDWLLHHVGDDYKIHFLGFNDMHRMYIDATLMPLAQGKLLTDSERVQKMPEIIRSWEAIHASNPIMPDSHAMSMTSKWINMNILVLDERRVFVEQKHEPLIKPMEGSGFEPILCGLRTLMVSATPLIAPPSTCAVEENSKFIWFDRF